MANRGVHVHCTQYILYQVQVRCHSSQVYYYNIMLQTAKPNGCGPL